MVWPQVASAVTVMVCASSAAEMASVSRSAVRGERLAMRVRMRARPAERSAVGVPQREVFLSLPRRSCWESTVSLGLVGVVESGPAVVVEPVLAGLSDGFSASVVFVVGGDVADGLVESDVVVVAADSVQLGF